MARKNDTPARTELDEIEARLAELAELKRHPKVQFDSEINELATKRDEIRNRLEIKADPWEIVQLARHAERPTIRSYIDGMFSDFVELHGDRCFGDDPAIIGGFATVGDQKVMLIGHQKGRSVEDNIKVNFGMARPEGYRKALRLMNLAVKYRLPVLSLIDTPGAYPGMDAEARGQAEAIANNLTEMSLLRTPIVVVVTGEGGSGGAIGIGVGDVLLMLANAIYSVISPEGCASILWRDGQKAPQAAAALKLTAESLLELGIIDGIIPEPPGGAHQCHEETFSAVKKAVLEHLRRLKRVSAGKLVDRRFDRYSRIGRLGK